MVFYSTDNHNLINKRYYYLKAGIIVFIIKYKSNVKNLFFFLHF